MCGNGQENEKERNEVMRQKDMKTKQGLEAVKSLTSKNTKLRDESSDTRIVMESTTTGLQKEKAKNDMKDSTI